jgi:hypothetical protein
MPVKHQSVERWCKCLSTHGVFSVGGNIDNEDYEAIKHFVVADAYDNLMGRTDCESVLMAYHVCNSFPYGLNTVA